MKKYYSLASAWVLALGMGMTSCSNDTDEPVTEQQQPQERVVYLSATAPDAETRAAVSGSSDSDAIKITGWKQGDVLKALYVDPYNSNEFGTVTFTFNASNKMFESTLPDNIFDDYIRLVTQGFDSFDVQNWEENYEWGDLSGTVELSSNTDLKVDLDNRFTNIPLWSSVYVDDDGLKADMNLPKTFSLACIHNNSTATIHVKMKSGDSYLKNFNIGGRYNFEIQEEYDVESFVALPGNLTSDAEEAAVLTLEDGDKAYLPFYPDYAIEIDGKIFKESLGDSFKAGKVYKATYTNLAEWATSLQMRRDEIENIVIETNVDAVENYQEDDTHKPLNSENTLWEVLEGTTLRIQASTGRIKRTASCELLFAGYPIVTNIVGLEKIDFNDVTDMSRMFSGNPKLTSLDLSSFNTYALTNTTLMFSGCSYLETLILSKNFVMTNVSYDDCKGMFSGCGTLHHYYHNAKCVIRNAPVASRDAFLHSTDYPNGVIDYDGTIYD